jgi:hypothetical protein
MFFGFIKERMLEGIDDWDLETLEEKFIRLENASIVAHACVEFPLFTICPPAFDKKDTWVELTKDYPISENMLHELYDAGFHPVDRELYKKKTFSPDPFIGFSKKEDTHLIVDTNYGLFLFQINGRFSRFGLDMSMYNRYRAKIPSHIPFYGHEVLDVGAVRGQRVTGVNKNNTTEIVEYRVKNRIELNSIINKISHRVSLSPTLELWFRGQPNDYFLKDLSDNKYQEFLPYRKIVDTSLVPSLFRSKALKNADYKTYYKEMVEVQSYVREMESFLGIKDVLERVDDKEYDFFKSSAWGTYDTGMTSTSVDQDGNLISKKDSYPGFFALQKSFFLQHYGLPSPVLDITSSIDIALFFAQNKTDKGEYCKVDFENNKPVLYLMLLDNDLDLFMSSEKIRLDHELLRPIRQKCGFIAGSSILNRNYYGRFISVKIYLDEEIDYDSSITPEYLFPSLDEDMFLKELLRIQEKHELEMIKPFYLKN